MSELGSLRSELDRAVVRFERTISASIDIVWDLISTGEGLEQWLAPATVDLREGGVVDIDFREDGLAGGSIIALSPGTALEYHWQFPGEPDSIIRFELTEVETGTHLTLEHRLLPIDQCVGYGAGWHAHIDHLEAIVTGDAPSDWDERFRTLLPRYETLMAAIT